METEILFRYGNTNEEACSLLNESIQESIKKGYVPQGGVSLTNGRDTNTMASFSSACILMVKKDTE